MIEREHVDPYDYDQMRPGAKVRLNDSKSITELRASMVDFGVNPQVVEEMLSDRTKTYTVRGNTSHISCKFEEFKRLGNGNVRKRDLMLVLNDLHQAEEL